jgi:hypothetical protein
MNKLNGKDWKKCDCGKDGKLIQKNIGKTKICEIKNKNENE